MSDPETAKRLFFEALESFDSADCANAEVRLRETLKFAPANASILTNLAMAARNRATRPLFDTVRFREAQPA
jgi:hypothetical protein